jgi:ring-1,2-phenylacetyl-CoA epoxidase subunit PaaE
MTATIARRRPVFHALRVASVEEMTDDSVAVTFAVPPDLREVFEFSAGQHLTVRRVQDGSEVRRSYSICSTPAQLRERGAVRIGVRKIAGGLFSSFACTGLRAGDTVEVLPPLGHFTTAFAPERSRHYAAVAAGSGITPVLSLITTALETEPESRFTLLYGNRRVATVMFAEELGDLKNRYPERLHIAYVLSREPQPSPLLSGRIDAERMRAILVSGLVDAKTVDEWFLCGPYGMVADVQGVLADGEVPGRSVHTELFHVDSSYVDSQPASSRAAARVPTGRGPATVPTGDAVAPASVPAATVTIILDGRESTLTMRRGERVLDAALRVRGDAPYACKGGVCSTCRAKLVRGEVVMAHTYALSPDEIDAGYVLTCQSSPVTDRLVVDYDA